MHPGSADHQQMPWMNAMQAGQMHPGQMQGFMDPAMMQAAMAAFQQGQGAGMAGNMPQMYFPAMQQQPGVAGMQVPMPVTMSAPAPAPAAVPAVSPEDQEKAEKAKAIQRMLESLSDVEKEYYLYLWTQHCGASPLKGQAAFQFLMRSKIGGPMLKNIWNLADWRKKGELDWQDFVVAMKLISAAQKRQAVSLDRVLENCSPNSMDCPEFEGIDSAAALRGRAAAAAAPAAATQAEGGDVFFGSSVEFSASPLPDASALKPGPPNQEQLPNLSPAIAADCVPASAALPLTEIGDASSSVSAAQAAPAAPADGATAASGGDAITDIMFGMAGSFAEPKAMVATAADADAATQPDSATAAAPLQPLPSEAATVAPAAMWDAFGAQDAGDAPRSVSAPVSTSVTAEGPPLDIANSTSQPPAAEASWSAFGETPATAAPAKPGASGDSEAWGAFGAADASAPAPAQEWSAFGEPPTAAASMPPAATPGPEAWDAFGGAPAQASNAKGQGDRWNMISNAFDDLLREDDVTQPPSAEGVEGAVDALAPAQPADPPLEEKSAEDFFGDFETSASAGPVALTDHFATNFEEASATPTPATVAAAPAASVDFMADFAPAEQSADSWGDFEASSAAPPPAAEGSLPAVPLAADFAADFSRAEENTDAWGDFEAPGSAPPATATLQAVDFPAASSQEKSTDDWGDFEASAPTSAEPVPAAALPADFTADFAEPAEPSSETSAAPAMPSEIEWPAFEPVTAGAEATGSGDWGAFDAAPAPASVESQVATAVVAGGAGAADLFFDDDKAESGSIPGMGAGLSDAFASAMKTAGDNPVVSAEASWGAFDDDDFVSATPAPPAPEIAREALAEDADDSAWSAEFASAAPAQSHSSPAPLEQPPPAEAIDFGSEAFSFEDPAPEAPSLASAGPAPAFSSAGTELTREAPDVEDEEHISLARSLADLGLYEDARRCQAHSDLVRRLSDAEARKKAAMAREDFEGCIAVRNEIQALNTELTSAGDLEAPQRSTRFSPLWPKANAQSL